MLRIWIVVITTIIMRRMMMGISGVLVRKHNFIAIFMRVMVKSALKKVLNKKDGPVALFMSRWRKGNVL